MCSISFPIYFDHVSDPDSNNKLRLYRGKAINAYAGVEPALCNIFGLLLGVEGYEVAPTVFYSITNTHSRNRIMDDLLEKRHGPTYQAYWNGIPGTPNKSGLFTIIRQLDQMRNEIVHWHLGVKSGNPLMKILPDVQRELGKPRLTPIIEPTARTISISELQEFIRRANFVERSLMLFLVFVIPFENIKSLISGWDEMRPTLREIFAQPASYPPSNSKFVIPELQSTRNPASIIWGVTSISVSADTAADRVGLSTIYEECSPILSSK